MYNGNEYAFLTYQGERMSEAKDIVKKGEQRVSAERIQWHLANM